MHDFHSEGDHVLYTNPGAAVIPAGEFVLNAGNTVVLGVTTQAIPVGATSTIYRKYGAIINVDKVPADVFAIGAAVNLVVASKLVSTGAGVAVGRVMAAAAAGTTKALIALTI
jgi:predicted RecA/RadA family phage recombinase